MSHDFDDETTFPLGTVVRFKDQPRRQWGTVEELRFEVHFVRFVGGGMASAVYKDLVRQVMTFAGPV